MPLCVTCGRESSDEFAFCPHCGASFAEVPAAREQRKTVTVLFCDVVGSTALGESTDPEALRALLARYFERMKGIVERHGGTVEKFIGDAVMAVFGVPVVHEDDALRALRAAVEMRDAFPELRVQGRIGVTTGEVVTGTEERLATGDAVNVAARLEQAAQRGEVLVGEETYRLTRDAVEVEEAQLLELKGKAKPVAAHRLIGVSGDEGFARRIDVPMVGREREQRLLGDAWERVVSERACQLFTILGPAGVGKSRLAAEFLTSVDVAAVVRGRCLPYGEGITYWPVVEVLKQLPESVLDEAPAATLQGLLGDESIVTSSDEIAWAFRKQLEAVASGQPLVCVFDDLHWGEETFLDLVEHVADLSRDAPILLLCMARPELLDRRTGWAGGKVNATNVLLEPLGIQETEQLIERLADLEPGLRERILEAAEGNPLFVEEMVALAQESGDGEITVPPTIQALLAARLDQLDPSERGVLERGAVEGRVFHRGAVQALDPAESQVAARLTALVRKELVRPDKTQLPGEDAFRFRHLLIRDAAYDALPKATRAELHERFATWLEEHGADLVELDEILGYHLEQAYRYRLELGTDDPGLGRRAAERLAAAGRRAHLRNDLVATVNLLGRAAKLTPLAERGVELDVDLSEALFWSGRPAEAEQLLGETAARAAARGDRSGELYALLLRGLLQLSTDPEGGAKELRALAEGAIPTLTEAGHELGLAQAWAAIGMVEHQSCQSAARLAAFEQACLHAHRAGDERRTRFYTVALSPGYVFGPTPVEEAIRWHTAQMEDGLEHPLLPGMLAMLEAMRGRFDDARSLSAQARTRCEELGDDLRLAFLGQTGFIVEMCAGDAAAAERALREGCELLKQIGEKGYLSTQAGQLGRALCALGRYDEAEDWSRKSAELGASDDVYTQALWRQVRGTVLAHRGDLAGAERLMREALDLIEQTDMLNEHADVFIDLAETLELGGRREEAAEQVRQGLALYEQKGNLAMAAQARARLEQLV